MLSSAKQYYAKLKENDAFGVLLRPDVLANYGLHRLEIRKRPTVMRSQPVGVEIELTNRCNLACIQCLRSRGLKPYRLGSMDFETYKAVLAQFPYVLNLSLNGFGEALKYERFFDVVEYSRKELPWAKIGIYSNGTLIDEVKAERMVSSGLTEINVSIDAAAPDTYENVRRGGELEAVHGGLRRLIRARSLAHAKFPLIGVNFVMLNDNRGELVPFIDQAADIGVDFVNCITYATYDWGFRNLRSPDDYARELSAARRRLEELGLRCKSFPSEDLSWSDPALPFSCSHFWGENVRITYAGEITLGCCTPFKETYSYGNVLEVPFPVLWNSPLFRRNRALANRGVPPNPVCASCDRYAKCFFREERTRRRLSLVS